jgi:NadR type nicotinamide-nucleotide adenylyltransferase
MTSPSTAPARPLMRPLRVVLTGSESTGKSSIAHDLAARYGAELTPESSREYALARHNVLGPDDVEPIARGQVAVEDEHVAAATARRTRLVIQDTDLLSTAVYAAHYYGACPPWVGETARARAPDLYLLLDIDVPWVADGVRDRGHAREELQRAFREAVAASGAPYVLISGDWTSRRARAIAAIDELLDARGVRAPA